MFSERSLHGVIAMLILISCVTAVNVSRSAAEGEQSTLSLACVAERPAAAPGDIVPLRAWASTAEGEPLGNDVQYRWEVEAGSAQAYGDRAHWNLANISLGEGESKIVRAKVTVQTLGGASMFCTLSVIVSRRVEASPILPEEKRSRDERIRGVLTTGKAFLTKGENEKDGYGLYSYLLFGSKPSAEERPRYAQAIEAYLRILPSLDDLSQHLIPREFNVTYIPVTKKPESAKTDAEWADHVLEIYDYARAKLLLNRLDDEYPSGPYIVSVPNPLSQSRPGAAYLFEDLRLVMPPLMAPWMEAFAWLTAKERSWTQKNMRELGLAIRNAMIIASHVVPQMTVELSQRIRIVDP